LSIAIAAVGEKIKVSKPKCHYNATRVKRQKPRHGAGAFGQFLVAAD
jgi:hypothetical protein